MTSLQELDLPKANLLMFTGSAFGNAEKEMGCALMLAFLQKNNFGFFEKLPGQNVIDFFAQENPWFWKKSFEGLVEEELIITTEEGIELQQKLYDFFSKYKGMRIVEAEEQITEKITFWTKVKSWLK